MIRGRKEIELQIKDAKRQLDRVIEGALDREKADEETIKMINNEVAELRSEICFEDTFEGKIEDIEQKSFEIIKVVLKKLSDITGKNYPIQPSLSERKIL
ncbi:hypothetical protein KAX02_13860 [candidate division WOR-3 bacterium]|nr:hypothetical protein [candidate division WOR-3 bacterium]